MSIILDYVFSGFGLAYKEGISKGQLRSNVKYGLWCYTYDPMNPTFSYDLPIRRIMQTWWPLAASWLMMSLEGPALSAVVARLSQPEINLAAYGGVVFPLALIIEAPIIMMLAASTALSKDWDSYWRLRRYMMFAGLSLTVLHLLVAFTPLYYVVVRDLIGVPSEILEPARIGLMIMTPWTFSIAYRRFNQGVLIRFGRSQAVGMGTVVRLSTNIGVLIVGFALKTVPGIVVGACAASAGVISEAAYAGIAVRPVIRGSLKLAPPVAQALNLRSFLDFYIPLAMTSLLLLVAQPMGSAAISRLPMALNSLAIWPVVSGLIFIFRSFGIAYNEVVVALLDEPRSYTNLRRFTHWMAAILSLLFLAVAATPLAHFWFESISALPSELVALGQQSLWFALPLPALAVWQSWLQGAILHGKHTGAISEAVIIYMSSMAVLLFASVAWGQMVGINAALLAMGVSMALQTAWLWWRSRSMLRDVANRDAAMAAQA